MGVAAVYLFYPLNSYGVISSFFLLIRRKMAGVICMREHLHSISLHFRRRHYRSLAMCVNGSLEGEDEIEGRDEGQRSLDEAVMYM